MNIVDRAKNIMFSPKTEWDIIKAESWTVPDLFTKYALILAAIPAVAGIIGFSIFGISWEYISIKMPFSHSLTWAVTTYIFSLLGVFLIAFIADALAPSFGSTKDMTASAKAVIFAYTPAWVAGIFYIIPSLAFIVALAGIYGLVLMYMGLQRVKDVPQDKMIGYFVVIIIVAIVVYFITGLIVREIAFSGYMIP
jgi:hypothetical protein